MMGGASAPVSLWVLSFFFRSHFCSACYFGGDVFRVFFAVVLSLSASSSFAVTASQACTNYENTLQGTFPGRFSLDYWTVSGTNATCYYKDAANPGSDLSQNFTVDAGSCSSSGASSGDFGWRLGYTTFPAGATTPLSAVQSLAIPPSQVCYGGCVLNTGPVSQVVGAQTPDASGHYAVTANYHATSGGSSCSSATSGVGAVASSPSIAQTGPSDGSGCAAGAITCAPGPGNICPKGSAPQVIGGAVTCVNYGTPGAGGQTSSEISSAASAPPGSSASAPGTYQDSTSSGSGDNRTTTTTTTTVGADGSTNTTSTSCTGSNCGNCTYTGPGSCGTTPNTFSGDCNVGFAAGGDAVADATATAANLINCELSVDKTNPAVIAGQAAIAAGDAASSLVPSSSSVFDLSSYLGSVSPVGPDGGCISDQSFSFIGGTVVTIPFSRYCDTFNWLGLAGNAITLVAALRIVFGRV